MSLLMDALKKAEQAKQSGDPPVGGDELRLEPIDGSPPSPAETIPPEPAVTDQAPEQPPPGRQLPDLPPQLEVLDAEFIAHAASAPPEKRPSKPATEAPPLRPAPGTAPQPSAAKPSSPPAAARPGPPPRPAAPTDNERKAAQQVFAAKQPERSRKGFAIAAGGITVVGIAAIGGYFWWQLQPKSGLAGPGLAVKAPAQASPASPALPPPQVAAAPQAAATTPAAAPALPAPAARAAAVPQADDDADEPPPRRAAPARTAPAATSEPASPVRITRSQLKVNPALVQGFDALNAGDLAAAQAEYERVLRSEPRNSDALHGLAAIAVRQGNVPKAEDYWLKALEADPKDAVAQAALISSGGRGGADPQAQESRLKTLIAAQPEVAALHFALGNVLARQTRWNEAQQAYFRAYSIEPEHPDYVFNLAVSLDQLRQPRLAAQYYNQALATAAQRPAAFDRAQVASRLRELQP